MSAIVKVCGCGLSYTAEAWSKLALVGNICDGVEALELRNCSNCGSTIAIIIDDPICCRHCGADLLDEEGRCHECGSPSIARGVKGVKEARDDLAHCGRCGANDVLTLLAKSRLRACYDCMAELAS